MGKNDYVMGRITLSILDVICAKFVASQQTQGMKLGTKRGNEGRFIGSKKNDFNIFRRVPSG